MASRARAGAISVLFCWRAYWLFIVRFLRKMRKAHLTRSGQTGFGAIAAFFAVSQARHRAVPAVPLPWSFHRCFREEGYPTRLHPNPLVGPPCSVPPIGRVSVCVRPIIAPYVPIPSHTLQSAATACLRLPPAHGRSSHHTVPPCHLRSKAPLPHVCGYLQRAANHRAIPFPALSRTLQSVATAYLRLPPARGRSSRQCCSTGIPPAAPAA